MDAILCGELAHGLVFLEQFLHHLGFELSCVSLAQRRSIADGR